MFKRALSYRAFRIKNLDQRFLHRQADRIGDYQKRFRVSLYAELFSGDEEIEVLNFLSKYKRACDNTGNSEGIALRLFRFSLKGIALASFDTYHNSHRHDGVRGQITAMVFSGS